MALGMTLKADFEAACEGGRGSGVGEAVLEQQQQLHHKEQEEKEKELEELEELEEEQVEQEEEGKEEEEDKEESTAGASQQLNGHAAVSARLQVSDHAASARQLSVYSIGRPTPSEQGPHTNSQLSLAGV
ncbi:neurofilament light polypeptide-like [Procambarus clarkii]|uniref:neurofilament light polypeptide-like n=1 Tax=Procambarus clarkii TaxID=6728 RepID=UPI003743B49F